MYDHDMILDTDYLTEEQQKFALHIAQDATKHAKECEGDDGGVCAEEKTVTAKALRLAAQRSKFRSVVDENIGIMVRAMVNSKDIADNIKDIYKTLIEQVTKKTEEELSMVKKFNYQQYLYTKNPAMHNDHSESCSEEAPF